MRTGLVLSMVFLAGCDLPPVRSLTKEEKDVARAELTSRVPFENVLTAPLEGGTAILVDRSAAYWVKDGIVYAANGTAKAWSPSVEYSPTGVDMNTVSEACDRVRQNP